MKLLNLLVLTFTISAIHGQINSVQKFKAPVVYSVVKNETGQELYKRPLGKNAFIDYDTLFKSYQLLYINENGEAERLRFTYMRSENQRIYEGIPDIVREEGNYSDNGIWYVFNFLSTHRLLFLNYGIPKRKGELWLTIDNIEPAL